MKISTWLHLRIPFSIFLLPVFIFSVAVSYNIDWTHVVYMFFILHIFLYPASNGFNSYFDKDQDSIGGLKSPPRVTRELYYVALLLDGVALVWSLLLSWQVGLMVLIYGLASKAYSHPSIRLKRYPFLGWFIAGFFQGFFTFTMTHMAINQRGIEAVLDWSVLIPGFLTTLLLWGSYPMTQVYQHEEDGRRGDETLSRKLGVKGTFMFTALVFGLANLGYLWYLNDEFSLKSALIFQLFIDEKAADFNSTMRLNFISSFCLNLFFISLYFLVH